MSQNSKYKYSQASRHRLDTCRKELRGIFDAAIKIIDLTIVTGHRGKEAQNNAVKTGNSKLAWPDGKHNQKPSHAIDAMPYPRGWKSSRAEFCLLAGIIKGIAQQQGIEIRWGGDWDGDNDLEDQTFNDLSHFELVNTPRQ